MKYIETPLLRDMRKTARDLGLAQALMGVWECADRQCPSCVTRVRSMLDILGLDEYANVPLVDASADPHVDTPTARPRARTERKGTR